MPENAVCAAVIVNNKHWHHCNWYFNYTIMPPDPKARGIKRCSPLVCLSVRSSVRPVPTQERKLAESVYLFLRDKRIRSRRCKGQRSPSPYLTHNIPIRDAP